MLRDCYHLIALNDDSDNNGKLRFFGPSIPKYPHIDPQVHDELLNMVASSHTPLRRCCCVNFAPMGYYKCISISRTPIGRKFDLSAVFPETTTD